jgi:hypothetical protein
LCLRQTLRRCWRRPDARHRQTFAPPRIGHRSCRASMQPDGINAFAALDLRRDERDIRRSGCGEGSWTATIFGCNGRSSAWLVRKLYDW